MGSQLRDSVRVVTGIKGQSHTFRIKEKVSSTDYTAGGTTRGALTFADTGWAKATASLVPTVAHDELDDYEVEQLGVSNAVSEIQKGIRLELGRKVDERILEAVVASNGSTADATNFPTAGVDANKAALTKLRAFAGVNNFPMGGKWTLAVAPKNFSELIALPEASSSDYNQKNLAMKRNEFMIYGIRVLEVQEVNSHVAPASGKQSAVFFDNSCIGLALGDVMSAKSGPSYTRNSNVFIGQLLAGAVTIQQAGVLRLTFN